MNHKYLHILILLSSVAFTSSCKLDIDAKDLGVKNPDLLSLSPGANRIDNTSHKDDKEDSQKRKKTKKNAEVLDFNENHTYTIDVSNLLVNEQEHISYDDFKNPKNIGKLFDESMSKSISHENSKKLDPVVEKLIKISKYYAKNQADLFYFLSSFVESLHRDNAQKRQFEKDYYYPYEYIQYGTQSDFENITMLSTIIYDTCYRPKVAIIDLDVEKSRIGINMFKNEFDYDQVFQNDQPRMDNFEKLVMRAPRCNVDISDIVKKSEEMKLATDEEKMLNVVSELSKDEKFLKLTIQPTELESLQEYYKEPILLIDSVDMKFSAKSIKDNSPPIPKFEINKSSSVGLNR